MQYYLMHKDLQLALLDLNPDGTLNSVKYTDNEKLKSHLPIGTQSSIIRFKAWFADRTIPSTRDNCKLILNKLHIASTKSLLLTTLALSPIDCYWIKPINSNYNWADINLHTHHFNDIFGELNFNIDYSAQILNTPTTIILSQGNVPKKWCIDQNNNRFLIKGNHGYNYQQSLNEILATKLHSIQNSTPYVTYQLTPVTLTNNQTALGCYCYCFCNEITEFISAWDLMHATKQSNNRSKYQQFVDTCINFCSFTAEYTEKFLNYLIMTDFLLSNTDRHMNNIGVLRNPDTLEYYGFAPIYDTGNSMLFRESLPYTKNLLKLPSCSFTKQEIAGLKNVKYRQLVDLSKLPTQTDFAEIYSQDIPERQYRVTHLYDTFMRKCDCLDKFQQNTDIWHFNYIQNFK